MDGSRIRRVLPAAVSLGILAAIYWRLDLAHFRDVLVSVRPSWLLAGLALTIPTTLLSAWRFQHLAPRRAGIRLGESVKLTLVASVLNMVLPSKMGDLSKAWFVARRGHLEGGPALSLVLFEKACDMLALLAWCVFGLVRTSEVPPLLTAAVVSAGALGALLIVSTRFAQAVLRPFGRLRETWGAVQVQVLSSRRLALGIAVLSLLLWLLHLVQIWLFIEALGGGVPLLPSLALTPLAILAGLLPLTLAGIGTRDAALIFFYRAYFAPPVGAALGLLCTLRYVLPALAGVPFLSEMAARGDKAFSRPATRS